MDRLKEHPRYLKGWSNKEGIITDNREAQDGSHILQCGSHEAKREHMYL